MVNSEDIVKAAILGIDKYFPNGFDALGDFAARFKSPTEEKEATFLKLAFASFLFNEVGSSGITLQTTLLPCAAETKKYVSDDISNRIELAIENKETVIFMFLVRWCNQRNLIVKRSVVPSVLNKALQQKKETSELLKICGENGAWLCALNDNWKSLIADVETEDNVWENGTLAQRKHFFSDLRKKNSDAARALLSQSFPSENAQVRLEFLELLQNEISLDDETFLVTLQKDKSAKVKLLAHHFLKLLDGSRLNALFLNYATQILVLKDERYLLLYKKKIIVFNENIIPSEEIFNAGVEKVSSQKNVRDFIFWLAQILIYINPTHLARGLNGTEQELIAAFLELNEKDVLLPSLMQSAIHFKNKTWARELLKHDTLGFDLLNVLDETERTPYYTSLIANTSLPITLEYFCSDAYNTINDEVAIFILEKLKVYSHQVDRSGYQYLALHLSKKMIDVIQLLRNAPGDNYATRHFSNLCNEMIQIIELKNSLEMNVES